MDQRTQDAAHETLSHLTSPDITARREKARRSAARNSKRVRLLKILLPVVSILVAGVVFGMTFLFNSIPGFDIGSVSLSSEGLVMTAPNLSGSEGDRSYKVSATRAIQRLSNPKIIDLEGLKADIILGEADKVIFSAREGVYDTDREYLTLNGDIKISWSKGYTANLDSAEVDLKSGAIKSDQSISIDSDNSGLRAGKVELDEDSQALRFTEGVKMTIEPSMMGTNEK
ncbi:MAG: LPS export ABC transporter periplasmic protein LptC [Stappiaceae bacterium]